MQKKPELIMGFHKPSDFKAARGNVDEYPQLTLEDRTEASHNTESLRDSLNEYANGIPAIPAVCQSTLLGAIKANESHSHLSSNYRLHALLEHHKKQIDFLVHLEKLKRMKLEYSIFSLACRRKAFYLNIADKNLAIKHSWM